MKLSHELGGRNRDLGFLWVYILYSFDFEPCVFANSKKINRVGEEKKPRTEDKQDQINLTLYLNNHEEGKIIHVTLECCILTICHRGTYSKDKENCREIMNFAYMVFGNALGIAILKLFFMYYRIEQMSKYVNVAGKKGSCTSGMRVKNIEMEYKTKN